MELGPAFNIIEVCLYLLALFPGKDWGTTLILSLLASFWSLDKAIVNIFDCQKVRVSSLAFSLAEMPLIWLIWIGLLWTLLSIISQNRRHSTTKRFWAVPREIGFCFSGKGCFHMSIKAVATSQCSSGKYVGISKKPFLSFQSELSLSRRAVRPCPVFGRRRAVRQCPEVDRRRAVKPCPVVESCRAVRTYTIVRNRRAVRSCPGVHSSIFMPQPSQSVSSCLDFHSSLIYKGAFPRPVVSGCQILPCRWGLFCRAP